MDCKHDQHSSGTPSFWRSRTGIGFIVIGAAAGYFLITEHLAHVVDEYIDEDHLIQATAGYMSICREFL